MTDACVLLDALKVDLGITTTVYDGRLISYLQNAQAAITRQGATLTNSVEDNTLTIQYAAWTWRQRDTGGDMPRMLRWALNNRIFSEHMGGG